jgi:hypothetical protein
MASWCRGGVDAAVCRSLGAVERRKRGGAVLRSAQRSWAARQLGFGGAVEAKMGFQGAARWLKGQGRGSRGPGSGWRLRGSRRGQRHSVATARLRWRRRGRQAGPAGQRRREGRGCWAGWQLGPGCSGSGLGLWRVGRAAVCGACSRGETGVRARVAGRPRGRVLRAGVRVMRGGGSWQVGPTGGVGLSGGAGRPS